MSIKCSLLGHRFGDTEVERDREEDGTEVVITITELETCTRCGETRVVSENKEVTTLEAPATGDADADDGADVPGPDAGTADGRDAAFVDAEGDEADAQADARGEETTIPDAESGTVTETEDDGVIIGDADGDDGERPAEPDPGSDPATDDDAAPGDGDGTDEDRDPGEWPDDSAVSPAERAGESAEVEILDSESDGSAADVDAGPAAGSAEDLAAAEGGTDDAAPAEHRAEATVDGASGGVESEGAAGGSDAPAGSESAGTVGVDDGSSAWPEEPGAGVVTDDAMGDWPEETKRDEPADSGLLNTELDEEGGAIPVPEGMFRCSGCGFETEVESSSLRAGDFCPECHRGTLMQRGDVDEE